MNRMVKIGFMRSLMTLGGLLLYVVSALGQADTSTLKYGTINIQDADDFSGYEVLKGELDNYNVFFTGENHQFRTSNSLLQLKTLKFLHQERGVKHMMLEFGFSRGYIVDEYIQTGDSSLLDILDDYSYKEYTRLYEGIREYNAGLKEEDRIHVHGIDVERSFLTSVKVLNMMLPDTGEIPDSIQVHVESLKSLMGYIDARYGVDHENDYNYMMSFDTYSEWNTLKAIIENYRKYNYLYKSYLGEGYEIFEIVVSGLEAEEQRKEYLRDVALHARIHREVLGAFSGA